MICELIEFCSKFSSSFEQSLKNIFFQRARQKLKATIHRAITGNLSLNGHHQIKKEQTQNSLELVVHLNFLRDWSFQNFPQS